jgi:hypothetical protein
MFAEAAIEPRTGAWRRVRQGGDSRSCEGPGWRLRTQIHGRPVSQYELSTIDILRYQSEARMLAPSRIQHEAEEGAVLLDRYYDPCPNRKPLSQEDKFISLLSCSSCGAPFDTCRGGVISPDRLRPTHGHHMACIWLRPVSYHGSEMDRRLFFRGCGEVGKIM